MSRSVHPIVLPLSTFIAFKQHVLVQTVEFSTLQNFDNNNMVFCSWRQSSGALQDGCLKTCLDFRLTVPRSNPLIKRTSTFEIYTQSIWKQIPGCMHQTQPYSGWGENIFKQIFRFLGHPSYHCLGLPTQVGT